MTSVRIKKDDSGPTADLTGEHRDVAANLTENWINEAERASVPAHEGAIRVRLLQSIRLHDFAA
jgi:hypothetical protein